MQGKARTLAARRIDFLRQEYQKADTVNLQASISTLLQTDLSRAADANTRPEYALRIVYCAGVPDDRHPVRPRKAVLGVICGVVGALLTLAVLGVRRRRREADHVALFRGAGAAYGLRGLGCLRVLRLPDSGFGAGAARHAIPDDFRRVSSNRGGLSLMYASWVLRKRPAALAVPAQWALGLLAIMLLARRAWDSFGAPLPLDLPWENLWAEVLVFVLIPALPFLRRLTARP